jgi:amidase
LRPESFYGPDAGLTEVLVPAGYVTTVYDPVFALSRDGTRYIRVSSETPIALPPPGLPFSLVSARSPARRM